MALEMHEQIGKLAMKWRKFGHELGFGIGIACGYATLGCVGYDEQMQYSATGSVTNLASRLCDEAKAGQILVDGKVHAAVEHLATTDPVGDLTLKGFRRPVRAFNVRGWHG